MVSSPSGKHSKRGKLRIEFQAASPPTQFHTGIGWDKSIAVCPKNIK